MLTQESRGMLITVTRLRSPDTWMSIIVSELELTALHVGSAVSSNSDTMMLIHVSGDRSRVTVISIPRDSWVSIPGHGMSKVNAAYGLGGPKLVVQTVEQNT